MFRDNSVLKRSSCEDCDCFCDGKICDDDCDCYFDAYCSCFCVEEAIERHKSYIANDPNAIGDMPSKLKTKEVCNMAVALSGYTIRYVPHRCITEELCIVAVRQNPKAIMYIPTKFRTHQVCLEAVKNDRMMFYALEKEHISPELMRDIAEFQPGVAFSYVADVYKTIDMCIRAVQEFPHNISHVPPKLFSQEICNAVFHDKGAAKRFGTINLKCIPAQYQTEDFLLDAIEYSDAEIQYVPDAAKTEDFLVKAIKRNPKVYLRLDEFKNTPNLLKAFIEA